MIRKIIGYDIPSCFELTLLNFREGIDLSVICKDLISFMLVVTKTIVVRRFKNKEYLSLQQWINKLGTFLIMDKTSDLYFNSFAASLAKKPSARTALGMHLTDDWLLLLECIKLDSTGV